jgi:hypothetical protein
MKRPMPAWSVSFLLVSLCALSQSTKQHDQTPKKTTVTGAQEVQARKLATQTKTVSGCVQRGYEPHEFLITSEDGRVWGLRSSAVKLEGHLGQTLTVSGLITHEARPGEAKKKGPEKGAGEEEDGDLRVASLKVVSETCGK